MTSSTVDSSKASTAVSMETTDSFKGIAVSSSFSSERMMSQNPIAIKTKAPMMDPMAGTATTKRDNSMRRRMEVR